MLRKASHLAMSHCDDFCNKTKESQELHQRFLHRGYVRTIKKRRSRFPDNYRLHKAFCMIDQGTEGDIVKAKIVELHKARKHTGLLMRMTVHDEITGDAQHPETLTRVNEILNQQSFPELSVPILWECKEGANWAECK
jgi:DNA polymerase I-like protein with 3'-5' exonuclease and polymerase domains